MFFCVLLCPIMTRNAVFSRLTRNNTCLIMFMFDHVCYTMFCSHVDEMWTVPSVKQNPNPIVCYFHTIMYCSILLITPANTSSQVKSPTKKFFFLNCSHICAIDSLSLILFSIDIISSCLNTVSLFSQVA